MDQQHVLHGFLLLGMVAPETNGGTAKGHPRTEIAARARTNPQEGETYRVSNADRYGTMEIGDPRRTYTIEPLEDPVPRELPDEQPAEDPEPVLVPSS
jgi:hypothetical protein